MKKVPFYANHDDNMHCAVAVYRMLFDYFLGRKLSWAEMDKMSGFEDGKAAWTVTIWERMSNQGFDIHMIEPFDYKRYRLEGEKYLREALPPEVYKYQVEHTNILEIQPYMQAFLERVDRENRRPTLEDIDDMLDDDRLVFIVLNSKALNGKEGYTAHAVLVIGKDGDDYIMHDPGLPPQAERRVDGATLWKAMGGKDNTAEVTGIKYKVMKVRADVVLANQYPMYSRAALAKLFDKAAVHLNGKQLKAGDKVLSNSTLEVDLSTLTPDNADIDLPVIYEDDNCIVINKPAGVLTHSQGEFNTEATVASFLRKHVTGLTGERAGVVHRLDRPTSGIIIGAKNPEALSFLQKQFADRKVQKTYMAIVSGHFDQDEAIIDMPIERNPKLPATFRVGANGKEARTYYKVIAKNDDASLVQLKPKTGRTHQLRVHMQQVGHPIIGDPLYGKAKHGDRLYLHAQSLEIIVPGETEPRTFTAPLPPEFDEYMGS